MPDTFLDKMELDRRIAEMKDRELMEFSARQIYTVSIQVSDHHQRIKNLENRNRKQDGIIGGIGAIIGASIATTIDFFLRRG